MDKKSFRPTPAPDHQPQPATLREGRESAATAAHATQISVNEIIERLRSELELCVKSAAAEAASRASAIEAARTREWFETKALPKAVRVA